MATFLGAIKGKKTEDVYKHVKKASECKNSDQCAYALQQIQWLQDYYGVTEESLKRRKALLKKLYSLAP